MQTVKLSSESGSDEEFWLNCIESSINAKAKAKMMINDYEVNFHIDTGAQVNTIQQKFVRKSQRIKKVSYLRKWNKSTAKSLEEAILTVKTPMK